MVCEKKKKYWEKIISQVFFFDTKKGHGMVWGKNIEKKNISNFLILNIDTFIAINNCLLDNTTISA